MPDIKPLRSADYQAAAGSQAFPVGDEEASYAAALKALRKELPEWNLTFTGKTDDVL